jgi:hypothetical protein
MEQHMREPDAFTYGLEATFTVIFCHNVMYEKQGVWADGSVGNGASRMVATWLLLADFLLLCTCSRDLRDEMRCLTSVSPQQQMNTEEQLVPDTLATGVFFFVTNMTLAVMWDTSGSTHTDFFSQDELTMERQDDKQTRIPARASNNLFQ